MKKTLKQLSKKYPKLTFQNEGYEYIKKSDLSQSDLDAIDEISEILKSKVEGFVKFFNFKERKDGSLVVRLDYQWDKSFTGVGYFPIDDIDKEPAKV